MQLSDVQLEAIRTAVSTVEHGSVTINISASSDRLDLDIHRKIRLEKEPEAEKPKRNT